MEIAGVVVTLLSEPVPVAAEDGRVGTAITATVETPDSSVLTIGLCTWDSGDRDLRTLSVRSRFAEYDRLVKGLRIGVHDWGPSNWQVELTTIGLTSQGSVAALRASESDLDALVHGSARQILFDMGALSLGTKEDLLKAKHGRRHHLVQVCNKGDARAALAAYVLCRVIPMSAQVCSGSPWKLTLPQPSSKPAAQLPEAKPRKVRQPVASDLSQFETPAWVEYRRWNNAVASVAFPETDEPLPVYLDLEEDVLRDIAEASGFTGTPRDGLSAAVRGVTVSRETFSLTRLTKFQRAWSASTSRRNDPPPCLAFLALSVLAAEDMGTAEDDISPIAYYPRLASLLGLPQDSHSVRDEYPKRAEYLWGALNRWLDDSDGLRGTPTAFALSRRYVGLPLSQALVREGDRRKFPGFFAQYGLAPGMDVAPEVVERYLDAWFGSESCPASAPLKRQWGRAAARERIAAVAAVELAGWDGTLPQGTSVDVPQFQRVGLMAQLRSGFMGSSLDLALTLRQMSSDGSEGRFEVEVGQGKWLPLNFQPGASNLWRTSHSEGVDMASVLEGVVRLRARELTSGDVLQHFPRTIVPLVLDELQAAYLEQERLQLNVDSMLLVREKAKSQFVADRVIEILQTCARPGFQVHKHQSGLPDGWTLITDVQLFGAPSDARFNELVPLARDQLTLAGGMRIPSRIRKWSSLAAPEVRASVESANSLRIVLTNLEDDEEVGSWESDEGALVVPLQDVGLGDGDYRAALFAGDAKNPLQQVTLRLRSGDTVDSAWALVTRLSYFLSQGPGTLGVLSASDASDASEPIVVDGALTLGSQDIEAAVTARPTLSWGSPKPPAAPITKVEIGAPDASSCVSTGAHYLEYPTYFGGRQPKFIEGVCRYCGLVKRSPGWIRPAWRGKQKTSNVSVDVTHLTPVATDGGAKWEAALDALMHLGGGSPNSLVGVASQIEGTALFAAAFPRTIEALGHISVAQDLDGTVKEWEISPPYLAETSNGEWSLVGFWPPSVVAVLADRLATEAVSIQTEVNTDAPPRRFISGVSAETVQTLTEDIATCVPHAGSSLLAALPRLSWLEAALPRRPLPGYSSAERFDTRSASWIATGDVSAPGAYRLRRDFETVDAYRSESDTSNGTYAPVSVYLSKHLAALQDQSSLVTYFPASQTLAVPRGADLPGLYARAMVLMSGHAPRQASVRVQDRKRNCLTYTGVDQSSADLLATLLTS